ncbi:MAG: DegT/DnrJ/EryC1/StrS family aminotransferase [Lachnospiraceae bacterium]|nr:DegT/DnrJ/EryC1/StrS family aminotransferase [Lachnospiraceae bacterium]
MEEKRIMVTRSSLPPFDEYVKAISPLWDSAWITNMGENHKRLEKELAGYLGTSDISLFVNGHMALEMCIQTMGLKGEVITTPFTFVSTTHSIVRNNLKPVFCDIKRDDYTMDPEKIEELITEKTEAIIPVHVYGHPCDTDRIEEIAKKHGLKVIYDAAHFFGVKYKGRKAGSFGDASMFSFHATKVYNTIEGGAIATDDEKLITEMNKLKDFGIKNEEEIDGIGANAKMNEFCAVMGLCNLKYVDENIRKRKSVFERYSERLSEIEGVTIDHYNSDTEPNYAYFPVIFDETLFGATRDEVYDILAEHNIYSRKYFYPLINEVECYRDILEHGNTENAKWVSERVLTLPMYASLEKEDVDRICDIITEIKSRG